MLDQVGAKPFGTVLGAFEKSHRARLTLPGHLPQVLQLRSVGVILLFLQSDGRDVGFGISSKHQLIEKFTGEASAVARATGTDDFMQAPH